MIFKGGSLQVQWFTMDNVPDWLYTTSENGWTSNSIAVNWLEQIFLPETKPNEKEYRILILDGHGSHISVDFLWACKQNKVELVFLPAHTSYVLQPLDLSCFSQIKTRYRQSIADLAALNDSAPVKKSRFISIYHKAREEGLTERVIRNGWKAAGIAPWNPEKAIQSRQVIQSPPPRLQRKRAPSIEHDLLDTPAKPQQLYYTVQQLDDIAGLSRTHRAVLHKAGKAIGRLNVIQAEQEVIIQRQQAQIERLEGTKQ